MRSLSIITTWLGQYRLTPSRLLKIGLTALMLGLGLYFVRHEGPELAQALRTLPQTPFWLGFLATAITACYILCCGLMYVSGFAAAGGRLSVVGGVQLWLRRNFISVFLPAGGVSSMAFYNRPLRRQGFTDEQIYAGSLIYIVAGYGSLLVVALPVLALGLGEDLLGQSGMWSVGALALLLMGVAGGWLSFRREGVVYQLIARRFPSILTNFNQFRTQGFQARSIWLALLASVGVELCGIAHVAVAIKAVGGHPTFVLSLTAYVVATLLYALSPVMRGLGAVEASMTVVLTRLGGLELAPALAATLYYRVFEFWLPLLIGLLSFVWKRGKLILRLLPPFLTLLLGITNLLSAFTPSLAHRLQFLESVLPSEAILASRYGVILSGFALVLLSVGLLRGYRLAWLIATGFTAFSVVAHLTKAIDYEEAGFAGLVFIALLSTYRQYAINSPTARRLMRIPLRRHNSRPPIQLTTDEDRQTALALTKKFGRSALDYFKTYFDKELYMLPDKSGFFAYRRSGQFVVVLETPILSDPAQLTEAVRMFEEGCRKRGYRTLYNRVDENDLGAFRALRKKTLFVGQEGLVDLTSFSLEGRDRKSLRNALKRVESAGYQTQLHTPPLRDGLVQQLRAVSDEWLRAERISESGFAQGVFEASEIKHQPVLTVENNEGKIMAFANIIPDFAPGEATYDLIRKTNDAPSGVIDVVIVGLIQHFQQTGFQWLNLGLTPLAGLDEAQNPAEQALKMAYERIRAFSHFKGLRAFKEKYASVWRNKYLVYGEELDLVQASVAIQRVAHIKTS